MIMRSVQELLEFRVSNRKLIDPEGFHVECMVVVSPGRIFPWILHIHADVVETFNLDPAHLELKVSFGNFDHPRWRSGRRLRAFNFDDLLRQKCPLVSKASEWRGGHTLDVCP